MNKEEQLRTIFLDQTESELWAKSCYSDAGFSDKYVDWLEKKVLLSNDKACKFWIGNTEPCDKCKKCDKCKNCRKHLPTNPCQ